MSENVIPGVIGAREEYDDIDMVWPVRAATRIFRADHPFVQPWYVRHPVTEEEIRVTCRELKRHNATDKPYFLDF